MPKNLRLVQWSIIKILCDFKLSEIDKLKEEYFDGLTLKAFKYLNDAFLSGEKINWLTLVDKVTVNALTTVDESNPELESLNAEDSNPEFFEEYIKILRENWERSKINEVGNLIQFNSPSLGTIKEKIYELVSVIDDTGESEEKDLFPAKRYKEIIESTKNKDLSKAVFTGVKELDELLGGFDPGTFPIIAGRPGMGKSAFALQIALENAFKRNNPTLLFSLEDTEENIVLRSIAHLTSINFYKLKRDQLDEGDEYQINRIAKRLIEMPLIVIDESQTINSIVSTSRKLKAKYPELNLIIVDYLQMIVGSSEAYETVSLNSRTLKNLAKDLDVVDLVLSQLNRECEKRDNHRPVKSDLRDSGSIEQDADHIIFPYRPSYYDPDDEGKKNICEYLVAKHRNGPIKNILGECFISCFQFN